MPIPFQNIPPNTLLPLFYAEVTQSPEPISPNLKLCLIGHMNEGGQPDNPYYGTADPENPKPYLLTRELAAEYFGRGSMLHWMYEKARLNAPWAEIWGIACPQSPTAIVAEGTITVKAAGSEKWEGLVRFHVAGRAVDINVKAGDTMPTIASRLAGAINKGALPVKAVATNAVVTLTCRWAGTTGNDIRLTYVGPTGSRMNLHPAEKNAVHYYTITAPMAGGMGEQEVASVFDALGERQYDVFAFPFVNQEALNRCREEMSNATGRWSPWQQLYGHMVTTEIRADYEAMIALGDANNDPHMTIMGVMQSCITPWEWTGALAGVMITHWAAPPELSRPLQTLALEGIYVGTTDDDSWIKSERQLLLASGISTCHVNDDNSVRIDRLRTLRKVNDWGDPDPSWADAITMFQAQFFVRQMRAAITGAFPRAALTTNDTSIPGFASPNMIRMVILHEYRRLERMGLVENHELFAQYLIVERNPVDRNRVDVLMRPDMVNQLRVVAVLVETHLELIADDPMLQAA